MSRTRGSERALCACVLAALISAAWAPFRPGFEGPYWARNRATFDASGALRVTEPAIARTPGPPTWLGSARTAGRFALTLDVRAESSSANGPARILSLSRDTHRSNLMVGQEGEQLVVRCRRPGSESDGEPRLAIEGVFTPSSVDAGTWRRIEVRADSRLSVWIDGIERAAAPLDPAPRAGWDTSYALAFGDEHTRSRPWCGTFRRATLSLDGVEHDLLAPATLSVPSRFWEVPERARRSLEIDRGNAALFALWHLVIFAPLGWCIARVVRRAASLRTRLTRALAVAAPLSLTLEAGKLLFAGRHPSFLHVVPDVVGAALGVWIASRFRPRVADDAGPRKRGTSQEPIACADTP